MRLCGWDYDFRFFFCLSSSSSVYRLLGLVYVESIMRLDLLGLGCCVCILFWRRIVLAKARMEIVMTYSTATDLFGSFYSSK